ncbi:MAG TPA: hypothetical protein VGK85_13500 [Myxococcaceae bacterium]
MMRASVVAAVAAMVCAGVAQAQAPQNENGGAAETAPPGGSSSTGRSSSVSTQGYSYQQSYTSSGDTQDVPPGSAQQDIDRELRGTSVTVGGGVEGYTGSLGPRVAVGPCSLGHGPEHPGPLDRERRPLQRDPQHRRRLLSARPLAALRQGGRGAS